MTSVTEKTVTNISIRAAYDSISEIMGARARDMIFKNAGLNHVIGSPPEYTWDKNFTNEEQLALYVEVINLVGAVGAQGVLRQIGYKNAETSVLKFGIFDHLAELPSNEKITKCFEFFKVVINKGKIVADGGGMPKFDVFDCLICSGTTSKKPYCSLYAGALSFFTDWVFGKGIYIVRETKCMALGDDTCLFEIEERP
jgi:predicted hydrocarbon binding protein